MKFKVDMNYLPNKVKNLKAYSTAQEKDILLASDDLSDIEILGMISDVKADNELEALYLTLKLREISVSDVLEGMIDCPSCQTLNQFQIELNEDLDLDESIPIGIFKSLSDIIVDADDLPIVEYNQYEEKTQKKCC